MAKLISQTYGQALYELAVEENKVEQYLDEVRVLRAAFLDGDDFIRFVKNPRVTQDEKQKVIEDSLKGRISDDILGFLVILNQKERLADIEGIFEYFISAVNEQCGIGRAKVSSPTELSGVQKEEIEKKLLDTTGYKKVEIEYITDPSLIGGIVIRVGDRVVDGSIRTRLYELKRGLI